MQYMAFLRKVTSMHNEFVLHLRSNEIFADSSVGLLNRYSRKKGRDRRQLR